MTADADAAAAPPPSGPDRRRAGGPARDSTRRPARAPVDRGAARSPRLPPTRSDAPTPAHRSELAGRGRHRVPSGRGGGASLPAAIVPCCAAAQVLPGTPTSGKIGVKIGVIL